jgi:carboxyl-terminal processing protease
MNANKLRAWLPLLLSVSMFAGILLGYRLRGNIPSHGGLFRSAATTPMQEVMELVRNRYVDRVDPDTIAEDAINALLDRLDPHSVFIPARELMEVNEDLSGGFEGIGVEFNIFEDTAHVLFVIKDGPSEKAGLQTGDRFLKVEDSLVAGRNITSDGIRSLLRGPGGSRVKVTLLRGDKTVEATITRGTIPLKALEASYMITPTTGYIRLGKFSETCYEEFMAALEGLLGKGMKELVLDLRDNGGGILDEAVEIADEFLSGTRMIVYTEGEHIPRREYTCRRNGLFETGRLVLLLDEASASASEVLAGALQDWDRATVIGRRSFGKGLVQEQYDLSDGSALRLTVARYYTPLGRSIQKPYTDGSEKYDGEILERFHNGGLTKPDTVGGNGEKSYVTVGGKKVYGGGGISPDVFVPIDSLLRDTVFNPLYEKNTLGRFAYRYFVANRTSFEDYPDPSAFDRDFKVDDAILGKLRAFAALDSIDLALPDAGSRDRLKLRLKALLARQMWRSDGYYEVLNGDDRVVRKALLELGR